LFVNFQSKILKNLMCTHYSMTPTFFSFLLTSIKKAEFYVDFKDIEIIEINVKWSYSNQQIFAEDNFSLFLGGFG
jgi:hypothetical protein